ncbi:hypothetical protein P9112_006813 [Eukaryota sp. TZLM1-RC]
MSHVTVFDKSGINSLLEAETEAAKMIEEARNMRAKRMLQAKKEAEQTIAKLQADNDTRIEEFTKEHIGDIEEYRRSLKEETATKIQQLESRVTENLEHTVQELLSIITCQ